MFAARLSGFSVTAGHLELHWVTYRTASSRYGHGLPPVGFSIASIPDIFLVLHASSVRKKSADSELKVPIRKPASVVTRTQPDELASIDYPKPTAPAANRSDSARVRIAKKRAARET